MGSIIFKIAKVVKRKGKKKRERKKVKKDILIKKTACIASMESSHLCKFH
jgi:hypothetical protein